jgi:hypothetical protein
VVCVVDAAINNTRVLGTKSGGAGVSSADDEFNDEHGDRAPCALRSLPD